MTRKSRRGPGRIRRTHLPDDYILDFVSRWTERSVLQIFELIAEDFGTNSPAWETLSRRLQKLASEGKLTVRIAPIPMGRPTRFYRKVRPCRES